MNTQKVTGYVLREEIICVDNDQKCDFIDTPC